MTITRRPRLARALTALLAAATLMTATTPTGPITATIDGASAPTAAASCWEIKDLHPTAGDGVYWLWTPRLREPERFFCDMTTDGGGWVLVGRGREGWDYGRLGLDSPAAVRDTITGPAAFAPRQLDGAVIDGLLNGTAVSELSDGVRLRRSVDPSGAEWREDRLAFRDMHEWVWPFGGVMPLASTTVVSSPGRTSPVTSTGQTVERFGADGDTTFTFQDAGLGFRAGFAYAAATSGSAASDSHVWAPSWKTSSPAAIPFSQVFIRPRLTTAEVDRTPSGAPTVSIESVVPHQIVQRESDGSASIPLSGRYIGPATRIDARWKGGTWTTIDSAPRSGFYTGELPVAAGGQGELEVRVVKGSTTTASATTQPIGVGDIFVIAGQSNAAGYAALTRRDAQGRVRPNAQKANHPTLRSAVFGQDDRWTSLSDPVSSTTEQIDRVSLWRAYGSPWPLLAPQVMARTGIPIAFVPAAMPGSSIVTWEKDGALHSSMLRRIGAVGGSVKGILWFQGETDAHKGMTQHEYQRRLTELVRLNERVAGVPTLVGVIGHIDGSGLAVERIRQAQITVVNQEPAALPGPVMYDVDLANTETETTADGLHYTSDSELATLAARWWSAVAAAFYGGADPWGSVIDPAASGLGKAAKSVTLVFARSAPDAARSRALRPASFRVTSGGRSVALSSVRILENGRVVLGFSTALPNPSAELRVAYGVSDWAVGHAMYDAAGHPVMAFYQVSIPSRR